MLFLVCFGVFYISYVEWAEEVSQEQVWIEEAEHAKSLIKLPSAEPVPVEPKVTSGSGFMETLKGVGGGMKSILNLFTFRVGIFPEPVSAVCFFLFYVPLGFWIYKEICRDAPAPLNLILTSILFIGIGILVYNWGEIYIKETTIAAVMKVGEIITGVWDILVKIFGGIGAVFVNLFSFAYTIFVEGIKLVFSSLWKGFISWLKGIPVIGRFIR